MSTAAQVVQGTCTPSASGTNTPLSTTATKVRSVLIQPNAANVGTVKLGYDTTSPVMDAPLGFSPIPGKVYNLAKVVVRTAVTGDGVTFIATL